MDFHFGIEINDYDWLWIHGSIGNHCWYFKLHSWPMVKAWNSAWDYTLNRPESKD